jgi:hypothetical protein
MNIISLGAGVQSSAMALMAARGEITPMPDCAIFADTQAEPKGIYDWLDWLETQLPFPVYRVTAGSLTEDQLRWSVAKAGNKRKSDTLKDGERYLVNLVPAFLRNEDNSVGMLMRKCTSNYKIRPIRTKVRALYEENGRPHINQWIGISTDEASRMKPSDVKYITHRFPLVEEDMSRGHCLEWMKNKGYPKPEKSACIYCPFQSDDQWAKRSTTEMAEISRFEKTWQKLHNEDTQQNRMRGTVYLHRSLKPIDEVDFGAKEREAQLDFFGNECEGMCGL